MAFSFTPTNIIKTAKRTLSVTIAGLTVAIATVAAPTQANLSKMTIPYPLEKKIANSVPSSRLPNFQISTLSVLGQRTNLLNTVLQKHSMDKMNAESLALWETILPLAAEIPFEKVFAQYDLTSESFFFVFYFKSGQKLEATIYNDEEDDYVYFSVKENDKVFFQNMLQRDVFFQKARDTWGSFPENKS